MVFIECAENNFVIASKSKIKVFNFNFNECNLTKEHLKNGQNNRVSFELILPEFEPNKNEKSLANSLLTKNDNPVCGKFSNDGTWFVVSDIYKRLIIWKTNAILDKNDDVQENNFNSDFSNDRSWEIKKILKTEKKVVQLCFFSNHSLLVGDKSCDIYKYNLETGECNLLFGHISMLLEMKICPQEKFIITCDRDEKVRVTNYPSVYNIQTFLLGHTEFVSCCTFIDNDHLVTGSGDSTIKLWQIINGKELYSFNLNDCFKGAKECKLSETKLDLNSDFKSGLNNEKNIETDKKSEAINSEQNKESKNELTKESKTKTESSKHLENRLAIKKLFYNIKSNILVVIFFNLPNLVTFKRNENKLILDKIYKLPSLVLDAIEYANQLFLLTKSDYIVNFEFKEDQFIKIEKSGFLTLINDSQELFKFNEDYIDLAQLYKFSNLDYSYEDSEIDASERRIKKRH